MQNIDYKNATITELKQLCLIRHVPISATKKPMIEALTGLDKKTENDLVCGVCKVYTENFNESCGCVCHPCCTVVNNDGFFVCGVCGNTTTMTKPALEEVYKQQQLKLGASYTQTFF